MDPRKKEQLAARGWVETSVQDFLGLTDEEVEYIELKLRLGKMLRECRAQSNITQVELAKAISSSQSRVAKMEKGDPSVTVDLQIRSLFAMGFKRKNLGELLYSEPKKVPA